MELTPAQAAAISQRGSHLLLAASAGAGKTAVLARRCVALVADPERPCDVNRLLVVTFTRAAAAELRVRVAGLLREEARATKSGRIRAHVHRQAALIEAADIGTIDAWCGRIVREHFAQTGVDVEFATLGQEAAQLLRREVLDTLFDQMHRGGEELLDAARAWIGRATRPKDDFLRDLISRLSRFRTHLVNPEAWLTRQTALCVQDDDVAVLAAALQAECAFQHEQLTGLMACAGDGLEQHLGPYATKLGAWIDALADPTALRDVVGEIDHFSMRKRRGVDEPVRVVEIKKRWLNLRLKGKWSSKVVDELLAHAPEARRLLALLLRLESRYEEMLQETKRRRAVCEFTDVQRMALDLLGVADESGGRTPTAIAQHLQRRYAHVLVDEFQDTSPVQVELLRLVSRGGAPCGGNRFMVGDVKQSIYGFREAEPRLFTEIIAAHEAGTGDVDVQYLSDNFRSHAHLLVALNGLFAPLFDLELGGTRFGADERLAAGRGPRIPEPANPTLDAQPRVVVQVLEQAARRDALDDDDEHDAERIEREAQVAAERINAALAGERAVQVVDKRTGALRPLHRSDIAILLRSAREQAGQVARVLRDNGIPCVTSGRESLLGSLDVQDVRNVLGLLVNRRQDVPLAAYLRSPLVGVSERDLVAIREAMPRGDFPAAVAALRERGADRALGAKLDVAIGRLDAWSDAARVEPVAALLRRIYRDTDLPLVVEGMRGGRQRAAALQTLLNVADSFGGVGQAGLADFVDYLDALAEEDADLGTQAVGAEDVVQIMTIHAAKGLEFPVVFLLASGSTFNRMSQRHGLQCDETIGLGLRFDDYAAKATVTSPRHHVVRMRVAQRELEEELRLLYVALTRAREQVFVIGHSPPERWSEIESQHPAGEPLPLMSRLSVPNRLEWVLQAVAAGGLQRRSAEAGQVAVFTISAADVAVPEHGARPVATRVEEPLGENDRAWVERGRTLIVTRIDARLAQTPAALSVSAAKEQVLRAQSGDPVAALDMVGSALREPAFAAGQQVDGAMLGTAVHRFLEHADFTRLMSVEDVAVQAGEMVAREQLTPTQRVLLPLEDMAWFGGTPIGALLARRAHAVRRELPMVHALPVPGSDEHVIVRGVIDCLVETPAGLVILDYKTDVLRDATAYERRVVLYRVQLQLYAQAAARLFGQDVTRAVLVFVRMRRMPEVPVEPVEIDTLLPMLNALSTDADAAAHSS